ncbi:MAG: PD-(D/E)XK nuclease family protein [Elusimicrobia bacterium]|nr:PD-(D/E)XK nuclease family protein [Elusimicrobiota bacterium]
MYLSYSKLSAFERCPFYYKKIYIERVKLPPKKEFSFGHSLHGALEKFYSGKLLYFLGLKKPTLENLLKYLDEKWVSEGLSEEENQVFRREAVEILKKYFEIFVDGNFRPAWRVEARFSFPVGPHTIGGFIDRIQKRSDGYEIIDYKTHSRIPGISYLEQDMQLPIYFLACTEFFRKKVKTVSYIFLRFMKKISFNTENFDEDAIKQRILQVAETIKNETEFQPKKNIYCELCDFKDSCGLF